MTQITPDMAATQTARPGERAPFEPPEAGEGPKTAADKTVTGLSHTVLVIWSIMIIVPLIWVVISSFKTSSEIFASPFALPSRWSFDNYVNAWTTAGIGSFFFNSVIVVVGALILTMTFGSMSAYVLARFDFPGNRALYYLMLAGLTFPIFLAIVPLFFVLRGIGLLNTLPGLIVTYAAFAFPFTVFFLYAFFRSLSKSIAEAAAVDGAGEWRTFFQIMLPMARPGLATVAILNFVGLWNQFLLPIALNTNPDNYVLTQAMASFASQAGYSVDFGALFAAVVITVVPVLIIYLIFQRQLQGSVSRGTSK
jgi:N-acetylglucosamine transport system permease protein